ncbi:peptidoglycan-binding protein [Trinickia terrae]|uniref:Peptidoglycan-binding protein n=1 Tax=Trinickia terrae TaxID=2571161 RepID=A0A4U1I5T0_9BURK|nr:peptidoglycan-binding protein [Trinickia terrae]TKC88713.1 peptidoglycan-binding protein [Trinickia terrae]
MNTLKLGNHGPDVVTLQQQLLAHGFAAGSCDGTFGPLTRDAVLAFQRSAGLSADGVVGPQTAAALRAVPRPPTTGSQPQAAPNIPIEAVRAMFPDTPLANIQTHLPRVLLALQAAQQTELTLVVAALATIRVEVASFTPEEERPSALNTSKGGKPFDLYDHRKDLGNLGPSDGATFKGRGFIQLTGRANYTSLGPLAGEPDLASQPERACDPDVAASLLAAFLKPHAQAIDAALLRNDFESARRLVNGGTQGLDEFTRAYRAGMAALGHA